MYNCIVQISGFLLSNYLSDNSIAHSTQVIHMYNCIVQISGFLLSNYLSDNSIAHSTQVILEF